MIPSSPNDGRSVLYQISNTDTYSFTSNPQSTTTHDLTWHTSGRGAVGRLARFIDTSHAFHGQLSAHRVRHQDGPGPGPSSSAAGDLFPLVVSRVFIALIYSTCRRASILPSELLTTMPNAVKRRPLSASTLDLCSEPFNRVHHV